MDAKAKRNYSFKKAVNLLGKIVANSLNTMAEYQNEAIQRGIDTATDINDKKFKRLSTDSTMPIRNRRKQGFTPLDTARATTVKSLRSTRLIKAKASKLVSKIRMINEHGVYHNEGFVTGSNSMIPGKRVDKREWFGITKDMRPSGAKYKNYVKMALREIARSALK
tara:strand:- start:1060 stop:1557 length:498 start_codon:yes stop_codon:yes gene_type:complete